MLLIFSLGLEHLWRQIFANFRGFSRRLAVLHGRFLPLQTLKSGAQAIIDLSLSWFVFDFCLFFDSRKSTQTERHFYNITILFPLHTSLNDVLIRYPHHYCVLLGSSSQRLTHNPRRKMREPFFRHTFTWFSTTICSYVNETQSDYLPLYWRSISKPIKNYHNFTVSWTFWSFYVPTKLRGLKMEYLLTREGAVSLH